MHPITTKKCVIFDFDGTIADTNKLHSAAFKKVFETLHIHNFQYESYTGRKTIEVFQDFLQTQNIKYSPEKIVELVALKQTTVRELMVSQLEAYDGAIDYINTLKEKGIILVIATSSSREGVSLALRKLGIFDKFNYIITGDDVKKAKPSPEIYIKALKIANVRPWEAVAIEDSISGAIAATKAKLSVIIVNNEKLSEQFYCTSFQALLENTKAIV